MLNNTLTVNYVVFLSAFKIEEIHLHKLFLACCLRKSFFCCIEHLLVRVNQSDFRDVVLFT